MQELIEKGIKYLQSEQQLDGSFLSLSSDKSDDFTHAHAFHSTFSTAIILTCLSVMPTSNTIDEIKQKAAAFLLDQKSIDWSFNYWQRNSDESKNMPYPDDLDDTFCALTALHIFNPKLFDGSVFAKIISLLTITEVEEGGPYRTWLVSDNAPEVWRDVDIAVNCNIAYFLYRQDISLPRVDTYISNAIGSNSIVSPYYHTELPILYFLSRFYRGTRKNILVDKILKNLNKGVRQNALENALAILSLMNLGSSHKNLSKHVTDLINQQKDGIWQPESFYIDPMQKGKKHYAGSAALTTTFCLYALYKFKILKDSEANSPKVNSEDSKAQTVHRLVLKNVNERFSQFNPALKKEATANLLHILDADIYKQITLLPYYLAQSMHSETQPVPLSLLIKFGSASVFGWIAYTLYDDFLDDEEVITTLPIANIALRELTYLFTTTVFEKKDFIKMFQRIMDKLEQANYWEVRNCRVKITNGIVGFSKYKIPNYGDYSKLAERSMGHAMAPAAILFYLGYDSKSPEVIQLLKFFKLYIIARQLNDDAHDFEQDMRRGHINAVGALLLTAIQKKYNKIPSNITKVIPLMHELFWNELAVPVCNDILKHIAAARKTINRITIIKDTAIFEKMLAPVEASAATALEEHMNVTKFLASYSGK
jgi:hypothetical protein